MIYDKYAQDAKLWANLRNCILYKLRFSLLQVVSLCRQISGKERERSHLLSMYAALCSCINSKEHRVRELVQDVLQLAGQELGLIASTVNEDSAAASSLSSAQ